jgi:hypothetical protein
MGYTIAEEDRFAFPYGEVLLPYTSLEASIIDAQTQGRKASGTPQGAQSKVGGYSCATSLVVALVSLDPRIHHGDRDWTSRYLSRLRENARAVAP